MKINGIEIKKDLIGKKIKKDSKPKKDSEKDSFYEKIKEYHNKLVNKYASDEFAIEVGLFIDLERIYVIDMEGRINEDAFYSDAYKFANQCGLDIIIHKRSGLKDKQGKPFKQVWDIFIVEDGEINDSKLKKDSEVEQDKKYTLHYDELPVVIPVDRWGWDMSDFFIVYDYIPSKERIIEKIFEMGDEHKSVTKEYIEIHLDELFKKYYNDLLKWFFNDAIKQAEEEYAEEATSDGWNGWDDSKALINSKKAKDSKPKKDSVKDDMSNAARELCREIKSLTEEDLKDSTVLIGDWEFQPYNEKKRYGGYYTAKNIETYEVLSTDDFEELKRAIKYYIYSNDKYFSKKAKDSKLKKDSSDDYIYLNGDKVVFRYKNLPIIAQYLISKETLEEPADWGEKEVIIDYDYEVDKDSVIDFITVKFLDENEIIDSDDKLIEYLDKYEKELTELFKEEAIEDAEDNFDLDEYYAYEKANSEYERKKEMNDSEEKIYFDNDGYLVIQYIFRKMPYGYAPKLNLVYDFLASLIKENAAEFKDVNANDAEALNEYIYENGRKLSNRFGKEIIEKFRDVAESEFYAKLFDYED